MRIAISLTGALALAACGELPDEQPLTGEEVAPAEQMQTAEPASPEEAASDSVEATLANRIPTRFHGVWDYVEGTCALESDMRMEVSGAEIMFYESIGTVTGVTAEGDDVVVSLAMEGEGDTWEQATRLSLTGEGDAQRLETSEGESEKVADEYPSKRCPS